MKHFLSDLVMIPADICIWILDRLDPNPNNPPKGMRKWFVHRLWDIYIACSQASMRISS